jgi:oligopeptide/dipeptide ABC transporter ATP-binding protein
LLELRDVHKTFPVGDGLWRGTAGAVHAVSGVSLEVYEGETLALVGESGCGKTTLGRIIVSLEQPTAGEVWYAGQPLKTLSRRDLRRYRRDIQFMFQDSAAALNPRMKVGASLAEPLKVQHEGDNAARRGRVAELVTEVGLAESATERYPHEFSGGQRQRVGLARALALSPRLIVADEPVSALDVSIQSQVLNLMKRLQSDLGLTYVVISHDLSVVKYLADRVGVMYLGKLVEIGSAEQVYATPAHPYTDLLLKSIPEPDPEKGNDAQQAAIVGELPSAIDPPSGCRFRTRCPRAQEICAIEEPPLRPFATGQRAACHFPLQEVIDESLPAVSSSA